MRLQIHNQFILDTVNDIKNSSHNILRSGDNFVEMNDLVELKRRCEDFLAYSLITALATDK